MPAAAVSFMVGTVLLVGLVTVSGQLDNVTEAANVRWYYLIGGSSVRPT